MDVRCCGVWVIVHCQQYTTGASPRYDGKKFKHEKLSFASSQINVKRFYDQLHFVQCGNRIFLFHSPLLVGFLSSSGKFWHLADWSPPNISRIGEKAILKLPAGARLVGVRTISTRTIKNKAWSCYSCVHLALWHFGTFYFCFYMCTYFERTSWHEQFSNRLFQSCSVSTTPTATGSSIAMWVTTSN